ncbi:uncharacterized protein LOC113672936 [Pocillopora damicornis]|uniref:uncharacterized protein LOC113672936 n=1 Tax=Pocillopora damicornis TaxID=46731 RepID=UPI000F557E9F|nr:uncharacterized protein LOC113672936 [Pocillopora damicornis]
MALRLSELAVLLILSSRYPDVSGELPDCFSNPVGVATPSIIFDRQMTASSRNRPSTRAAYGRLNDKRGDGWCSLEAKSNAEWLQVDIGKTIQACGLATQGGVPSTRREWVKDFKLDYSFDGENWKNYRDENGEVMVFRRMVNSSKTNQHKLPLPVYARYFRFLPTRRHERNCLRVEIYEFKIPGCQDIELGLGNGYFLDRDISSSSVLNTNTPAKNGRLNYTGGSSWCAATNDSQPYLQFDFEKLYIICAVSTQGNSQGDQWVKKYTLQSSKDGTTWTDYREAGILKIFTANINRNNTKKQTLCNGIVARFLRIIAQEHYGNCCMRVETFGTPLTQDLALNQSLKQSSTWTNTVLDGDIRSCAKGTFQKDHWMRVDLGVPRVVAKVVISHKRMWIDGLEVWIGHDSGNRDNTNLRCGGQDTSETAFSVKTAFSLKQRTIFCLPRLVGKFVFIGVSNADKTLYLCEVQVYSQSSTRMACQTQAVEVANKNIFPEKSFSASSFREGDEPYNARLRSGMGAWSPRDNSNADDYVEINLGNVFFICAVATQGSPHRKEWTKSYKLYLFLEDWMIYKENDTEKIFIGNSHRNEIVQHVLVEVARARIIRFQPVDYHIHKALRVEVYGIRIPAGPPAPPIIENQEQEMSYPNLSISWSSGDTSGCPVTMYTVYYKSIQRREEENTWNRISASSSTRELSALPLDCDTEYELRVSAWNELGESNPSESWKVKSITGYPVIVNRTNQVEGSLVAIRWKPCTASLFTICHREILPEGKSHWNAVNVSGNETSYDLHLRCRRDYEIAITAWNSTAETPLTGSLNHRRLWSVRTLGGKPSSPIIDGRGVQLSGCDVSIKWSSPPDNGCPLTLYTVYYREVQSTSEDGYWHQINVTRFPRNVSQLWKS